MREELKTLVDKFPGINVFPYLEIIDTELKSSETDTLYWMRSLDVKETFKFIDRKFKTLDSYDLLVKLSERPYRAIGIREIVKTKSNIKIAEYFSPDNDKITDSKALAELIISDVDKSFWHNGIDVYKATVITREIEKIKNDEWLSSLAQSTEVPYSQLQTVIEYEFSDYRKKYGIAKEIYEHWFKNADVHDIAKQSALMNLFNYTVEDYNEFLKDEECNFSLYWLQKLLIATSDTISKYEKLYPSEGSLNSLMKLSNIKYFVKTNNYYSPDKKIDFPFIEDILRKSIDSELDIISKTYNKTYINSMRVVNDIKNWFYDKN